MSFSSSLALTLIYEGGKADDPNDPGGRTNYGITQNVYDPTRQKDVFNITMPEVTAIYYKNYWLPAKCDKIDAFNPNLATAHFDCAVNTGTGEAAILLQRAAGVKTDGIIGKQTLAACASGSDITTKELVARRNFYALLISRRPNLKVFWSNWNHRVTSLALHLGVNLPPMSGSL